MANNEKQESEIKVTETSSDQGVAQNDHTVTGKQKVSKLTIVAAIFGALLVITAFALVIFSSLNTLSDNPQNEEYISANERILTNLLSVIEGDLNDIDEDVELADFDDSELAVEEGEEELESALDDMDTLMDELDSLEDDLADFEDSDFGI